MSIHWCSVKGCTDRSVKKSFFRFPREPEIKEKWVEACGRVITSYSARICSDHFSPTDFKRNLKNELMPTKLALVDGAVPTIKLPGQRWVHGTFCLKYLFF